MTTTIKTTKNPEVDAAIAAFLARNSATVIPPAKQPRQITVNAKNRF